jgi:hypothetical protein
MKTGNSDRRGLNAQLTRRGGDKAAAARRTHRQRVRRYYLENLTVTDRLALADIWRRHLQHNPD